MPRTRPFLLAAAGLAAAGIAATAVAFVGAASAATGASSPNARPDPGALMVRPIGTYASGAFDEGAAEIVGYDPRRERAFVTNADAGTVDVLDLSDPTEPTLVDTLTSERRGS